MNSKRILGLALAGIICMGALSGCGKKENENNADGGNGGNENIGSNGDDLYSLDEQYGADIFDIEIEKSDLVADENVYAELVKINDAGWRYYNEHFKDDKFISNCSYLYSLEKGKEVLMQDLTDEGYYICPEGMEALMDTDIHLIMPSDVIEYGVDVLDADFACFFTALRTSEGVFISSPEDKGGMMSYENYRKMILKYVPEHGDIVYPKKNDDNYKGIISAVNEKTGKELSYDVKYMVCDDEYAIAILGNNDKTEDIKGYILNKDGESWNVFYEGIEKSDDMITGINVKCPYLSASMIPKFSMGSTNEIKTDLSKIIEGIKATGLVEDDDTATYQCGAGKFVYIEFESGKKIAGGAGEDNDLKCVEVSNAAEAVQYMRGISEDAPIFIIKMNY